MPVSCHHEFLPSFPHQLFYHQMVIHYFCRIFVPSPWNPALILMQSNSHLGQLLLPTPWAGYSQSGCSALSLAWVMRHSHPQPGLHTGTQEPPAGVAPLRLLEAAGKTRSQGRPGGGKRATWGSGQPGEEEMQSPLNPRPIWYPAPSFTFILIFLFKV